MNNDISSLVAEIAKLPPDWHGVGSLSPRALQAIARAKRMLRKRL
jgi:hypothetical protein